MVYAVVAQPEVPSADREKSACIRAQHVVQEAPSSLSPNTGRCRVCLVSDHTMEKSPFVVHLDKMIATCETN